MTDAIKIMAETFALAEDAPTSFEDEEWLDGFEAARCMIAARLAENLERAGVIESASAFLDACGIPEDDAGETELLPVPEDWPVQPLQSGDKAERPTTCGTCGRTWDDAKVTGMTPTPSARCPFEAFHGDVA